ncbi:pilus assembly protein PilP [Herbaspirillum sp. DW155]|uniref:hypothetical protein n=1 Tax=Herbaspirillum sp. DW155 TaxID=3095609 RepID=UPI00308B46C4|nr:pilus assembly protein PilP [Herbaspirillum sp. DW155]
MSLLWLALLPLLLAGVVYGAVLAVDHPDEVKATQAWREQTQQSAAARAAPAVLPAPSTDETDNRDHAELPDPFRLSEFAPAIPSRRAAPRVREHDDDDEGGPAQVAVPAVAVSAPAPTLRLLGTLRRDQEWIAIAELKGATRQLQAGDALPDGLGRVLAVREEAIDIGHDGQPQTIAMTTLPTPSPMTLAPSRPPARNGRGPRRRLIRPGVTP